MDWRFILSLIFALIVAIFALQNAETVNINFLLMDLSMSQALVIFISAIFGAATVMMLSIVRWIKLKSKIKSSLKTITVLEEENNQLKLKLEETTTEELENNNK
ncbi:LapA family protein [Clostridium sp. HMP27]|uniref:LapA family protein n=1 Tax=Clostridium sp. HMP27 TaxID=1487921 RepID=UPI00068CCA9E|nr:LapA family protein [Clostridium sp. HMP27]